LSKQRVAGFDPATAVMTGMPAFCAASSWASASTGLAHGDDEARRTLAWIIASICSACFGRLPSELRIWDRPQPLALGRPPPPRWRPAHGSPTTSEKADDAELEGQCAEPDAASQGDRRDRQKWKSFFMVPPP